MTIEGSPVFRSAYRHSEGAASLPWCRFCVHAMWKMPPPPPPPSPTKRRCLFGGWPTTREEMTGSKQTHSKQITVPHAYTSTHAFAHATLNNFRYAIFTAGRTVAPKSRFRLPTFGRSRHYRKPCANKWDPSFPVLVATLSGGHGYDVFGC